MGAGLGAAGTRPPTAASRSLSVSSGVFGVSSAMAGSSRVADPDSGPPARRHAGGPWPLLELPRHGSEHGLRGLNPRRAGGRYIVLVLFLAKAKAYVMLLSNCALVDQST